MPPQPGQPERGWAPPPGHLELHSVKDHAKAHHAKAQNAHTHMPWNAAAKAELLSTVQSGVQGMSIGAGEQSTHTNAESKWP